MDIALIQSRDTARPVRASSAAVARHQAFLPVCKHVSLTHDSADTLMDQLTLNCHGVAGSCLWLGGSRRPCATSFPRPRLSPAAGSGLPARARRGRNCHQLQVKAVASVDKPSTAGRQNGPSVDIDNKADKKYSTVLVNAPSRSGLLAGLSEIFAQSGLDVCKAIVDNNNGTSINKFLVCRSDGSKVEDAEELNTLQQALKSAVSSQSAVLKRPKLKHADKSVADDKKNFLYTLMGMQSWLLLPPLMSAN